MAIGENILCFWKQILSYGKKEWQISDYPLKYKKNNAENGAKTDEWFVQVVQWWGMLASGPTKEEALKNLGNTFANYKWTTDKLPRPGTVGPIEFAATTGLEQLEELAIDFFPSILGYDYYGIFVSDESSIFDFGVDEQEIIAAINARYQLQLTALDDGNIVRILSWIKASQLSSR